MSRGLGISQGTGLPFWAACEIDGAAGTFRTGTQHPGFASCVRHSGIPAGDYDLTLSEPLADGTAVGNVGIITHSLAGIGYSITRVSDTVWRIRTFAVGGALADEAFFFTLQPTSPAG